MIRPKNETESFLFSLTKNCETPIHQTHTKPQETLEYKLTKSRKTCSFKPSSDLGFDFKWMVGLQCLEVYNSFFNITEEINKFELHTDIFDEFLVAELKDELEEILDFSIFSHEQ